MARIFSIACVFVVLTLPSRAAELLRVDQPPVKAELAGVDAGGALLFSVDDATIAVETCDLVRWSTLPESRAAAEARLTGGSRISLAPAWMGPPLTVDRETASVRSRLFGRIEVARTAVRGALWKLPPDAARRLAASDRLFNSDTGDADRLQLAGGDLLTGRLQTIATTEGDAAVRFESSLGPVEIPADQLAGLALHAAPPEASDGARLLVGLSDGSRLVVTQLAATDDSLRMRLACGVTLSSDAGAVRFLQTMGGQATYLSDLEPTGYRNIPYLELPWPFHRDRNVLGGPLVVAGKQYAKGLGMHSASRLTYKLNDDKRRFVAAVGIDDAALDATTDGGSVVFRVYLGRDGAWRQAYQSATLRGGDPREHVTVDLNEAEAISLVVDFADRGDERDYADWLDARLE